MSSYLNEYPNEHGKILGVTMRNIVTIKPKNGKDRKEQVKIETMIVDILTSGILKAVNVDSILDNPLEKWA